MNSWPRFCDGGFAVVLLLGWGAFTHWLAPPQNQGALISVAGADHREVWSTLGGLREAAAGLKWVQAYGAWRDRDDAELASHLAWVARLDPEPLVYWLNGARMLAFDVAVWRMEQGPKNAGTIRQQQLQAGLAWLETAATQHPGRSALPIEQAVLHWTVNRDVAAVEEALATAQACADAPPFVVRLRAEMMRRDGRLREALNLLQTERNRLTAEASPVELQVLDRRITELEIQLGVSPQFLP